MFKALSLTVSAVILATLALTTPAYAWRTSQDASAACEGSQPVISWEFTNTEPNEDRLAMDVTVTDSTSGQTSGPVTANPGDTVSGTLDISDNVLTAGTITFDLTWTDGRSGIDSRTAHYDAVTCQVEPIQVCRDGQVISIDPADRLETDTNAPCPEQIQVCRDGEIITINEADRRDTDTDTCPVTQIEVCRDGKIITIDESDRLASDTDGCTLGEGGFTPTELPKTGLGSMMSGLAGISSIGYGIRSWTDSKKAIARGLLSR
jgi:hypothetical protein